MVDYSVQMAATQRGMMWAIEVDGQIQGMVSGFDWQPSHLRIMMRVDALPALTDEHRASALQVCLEFLQNKYHVRNFGYQWIEGQKESIKYCISTLGFECAAILRGAWRTGDTEFADVHQYHFISDKAKPVPKRLGDGDSPGQNLNSNGGNA